MAMMKETKRTMTQAWHAALASIWFTLHQGLATYKPPATFVVNSVGALTGAEMAPWVSMAGDLASVASFVVTLARLGARLRRRA